MASNRNSPPTGKGANEPDNDQQNRQSVDAAADVDWMIISDISTRISGYPQPTQETNQALNNLSTTSSSQAISNQVVDDDLEDLEWLRSLGLDEPIERSSQKNTSSSQGNNDVENIDWLIVSDLKTRMVDSDKNPNANPIYQDIAPSNTALPNVSPSSIQTDSLDINIFDDDLGLEGLELIDNSDFSNLDSLDFDSDGDFRIDELQNEIDITEGKIQELSELLDDNFDTSNDNKLDRSLGNSENIDNQFDRQSSFAINNESFEMPTQITSTSEIINTTEDDYENIDLISDQLSEPIYLEDLPENLLIDDLESPDTLQSDELIEEFAVNNEFQDVFQKSQNVYEENNSLAEDFGNDLEDGFEELQPVELSAPNVMGDEIWESNVPSLESEGSNYSNDDAFASDWGETNASPIDDDAAIWDSPVSSASEAISSTSVDNAFGTLDDWAIAPRETEQAEQFELQENTSSDLLVEDSIDQVFESEFVAGDEQTFEQKNNELEAKIDEAEDWSAELEAEVDDDEDWSAGLEAEIDNNPDVAWSEEIIEDEEYLETLEMANDDLSSLVDSSLMEENSLNENFNFSDGDDEAIANNLVEIISDNYAVNDDFTNIPDNLAGFEQDAQQPQFIEFEEHLQLADSYELQSLEDNNFDLSENLMNQSTEWENSSESDAEQMTDLEFADAFSKYAVTSTSNIPLDSQIDSQTPISGDAINTEVPVADGFDDLESILDENFDLESFDEEIFPETPFIDSNSENVATTLAPNRVVPPTPPENPFVSGFTPPSPPSIDFINDLVPPSPILEDALIDDLLNAGYAPDVDLHEEALVNDLLNENALESDTFDDDFVLGRESLPSLSPNLATPSNFDVGISDQDFLDDFDLDSVGEPLTGNDFDAGFASSKIPTGLTPPTPPTALPFSKQEPTSPSLNNLLPLPFLPPLPPKRNSNQPKPSSSPTSAGNSPSQSKNRISETEFDSFHSQQGQTQQGQTQQGQIQQGQIQQGQIQQDQNKNQKSINSIDEGWSELLDAETVLSGVLRSPTASPYLDPNNARPPNVSSSRGGANTGRSQGGEQSSSNVSKRKQNKLHDYNELGLEIHDDGTDWSGLLDSGDLSDSITSISSSKLPLPSQGRATSPRSEGMSVGETREIPRDRQRQMPSYGDATQARMAATPDQMDFNRFTEDNYNAYDNEPAAAHPQAVAPSRPKITLPTVSLESLWQDYLKIPAIGLGVIGGAFLLYSLLNRPVFDLGLRWGLFKDASGKDFTNTNFKGAKLDNVNFSKAILTGSQMQDASLVGANFQDANLDGVNFTKANLSRARLIQASVIWAEFNNAQMNLVDLAGANLERSNFVNAKMEGVNLKDSKIGAQGTEKATKFSSVILLSWQIVNEARDGRSLADQNLSGLNLSFSSLKRANLTNSKLNYTDLTGTDLSGANLSGSQVNGANWSGANLTGVKLSGVAFDKNKLPKTDEETVCPNGKKGVCKF